MIDTERNARMAPLICKLAPRKLLATALVCATALSMSACGGGAYIDSAGNFNIVATVAGTSLGSTPVATGGSTSMSVRAGQSVSFDAGEPVVWSVYVGSATFSGTAQLSYSGLNINAASLDRYSIAINTSAPYGLLTPVPITLVATSTYDSTQIVTIHLLVDG